MIITGELVAEIAGLMLIPAALDEAAWTATVARDLVEHINGCDTEDERQTVETVALDGVLRFFGFRLRWLETLLISFNLPVQPQADAAA